MKTFVLSNNANAMIIKEGLPIGERYRKDKETGEKKYYPVGCLNPDKARSSYFFLSKSFHELIEEKHLKVLDNLTFKQHTNLPSLLIAFPTTQDTECFLVFDGYRRDQIIFVDESIDPKDQPCPWKCKPSLHYTTDTNGEHHCAYCQSKGTVPTEQPEAVEAADNALVEKSIKASNLVNKFYHEEDGTVWVYTEDQKVKVQDFLESFAVTIEDGTTLCFLLTRKDTVNGKEVERQYYVRFTYNIDLAPIVTISPVKERGMTEDQYYKMRSAALEYENMLMHLQPNGDSSSYSFYFPGTEEDDSPFSELKNLKSELAE